MSAQERAERVVIEIEDARNRFRRFPAVEPPHLRDTLRSALDREMGRWCLAYLAGAWLVLQMLDVLSDIWRLPLHVQQGLCVALGLGFLPALVIAWYHGYRGRQRVTPVELLVVGSLVFSSGAIVWMLLAA